MAAGSFRRGDVCVFHREPLGVDGVVRVLQVTDSHLYCDPRGTLAGLNTLNSLDQVLAQAAARPGSFDCVLATGDLVHDATPEGYAFAAERLGQLGRPVHCLPGNHDVPAVMEASLNRGRLSTSKVAAYGNWLIILLDSTLPNREGGRLSAGELEGLETAFRANPGKEILICLHHHPVPVGSAWMDRIALDQADSFFEIVDRHDRVRGILWGHVHQEFDDDRGGVRLMGSPSTCIQFAPGLDDFGIDPSPPGFRWLELHPDGRIVSEVERIAIIPDGLDVASGGYK